MVSPVIPPAFTISLVIPALNEEESIGSVLDAIHRQPLQGILQEILVVDNGSSDSTSSLARQHGACVLSETQRGYGWACAAGARQAQGEILVFMDADGADDPRQILDLVEPFLQPNGADMVLGSRLRGRRDKKSMPFQQLFGNWLAALCFRRLYGLTISDLAPFRAVRRTRLLELDMQEMTYGWPTEMIAKAARAQWKIVEIPVNYHPRQSGQSKISGTLRGTLLAAWFILTTILRYHAPASSR
jgi:glycosyltransferase involved in cell wall biosynthesis